MLPDEGDIYVFAVEIKSGCGTVWPASIPAIVVSNFNPEQRFEGQSEARKDALKRRFTMVEVRWEYLGQRKLLVWKFDHGSGFKPPTSLSCRPISSDDNNQSNPFAQDAVTLRSGVEMENAERPRETVRKRGTTSEPKREQGTGRGDKQGRFRQHFQARSQPEVNDPLKNHVW
jgi:hypothetical protein